MQKVFDINFFLKYIKKSSNLNNNLRYQKENYIIEKEITHMDFFYQQDCLNSILIKSSYFNYE